MAQETVESIRIAEAVYLAGEIALVALMCAWTFAFWRNYRFTKGLTFQSIPFVLGIALFSLAFYSERFH